MGKLYKNLEIFKIGYEIAVNIYDITKDFPNHEIPFLTNQMRRVAILIPSNIAEGSTRYSSEEFFIFLTYSYGSAKELSVQLSMAKDVGYISQIIYDDISMKLDKFQAMIYKFVRDVEKKIHYTFYKKFKSEINT